MSRGQLKCDGIRAETKISSFGGNGRVHLIRRGASVQSTAGSRGVLISDSNAGYNMFRGSVKGTGYPLNSPVSPSFILPCVTVCHHSSTGFYQGRIMAGKGGWCVRLTTLQTVVCRLSRIAGTLIPLSLYRPCPGTDSFTIYEPATLAVRLIKP